MAVLTKMIRVKFQHWKTDKELQVIGEVVHDNANSERIVVKKEDGTYEDVIKDTIIEITPI